MCACTALAAPAEDEPRGVLVRLGFDQRTFSDKRAFQVGATNTVGCAWVLIYRPARSAGYRTALSWRRSEIGVTRGAVKVRGWEWR